MKIPEIKSIIDQGKYVEAIEHIDKLGEDERLEGLILKSRIMERQGKWKEALTLASETLLKCRANEDELLILNALISLGYAHYSLRNIPELTEILQEAENLLSGIKAEQETIQRELDKWNELIQRKASIQERIEHAQIANWLVEAKKIQESWVNPSTEITNQ